MFESKTKLKETIVKLNKEIAALKDKVDTYRRFDFAAEKARSEWEKEYRKTEEGFRLACAARDGYRLALAEAYKRIAELEQANAAIKGE